MESQVNQIGRIRDVQAATGLRRATIYKYVKKGLLPPAVSIAGHAKGWPMHEIQAINVARIAGKSDDEIKALVVQLEAKRAG